MMDELCILQSYMSMCDVVDERLGLLRDRGFISQATSENVANGVVCKLINRFTNDVPTLDSYIMHELIYTRIYASIKNLNDEYHQKLYEIAYGVAILLALGYETLDIQRILSIPETDVQYAISIVQHYKILD